MLKAVIFDFDGVISDSEPCHLAAYNKVLEEFGIQISEDEYYAEFLGFTDFEAFEDIQRRYKTDFKGLSIEQLIERKAVFFQRLIAKGGHLIDGIVELIGELETNNIKLAVNSGATAADIKLMLAGSAIENSFDVIISADDVSKGKPEPDGYLLALKKLNEISDSPILPKNCVVIEDSHWGIISAKKTRMRVIGLTSSYSAKELNNADLIVDSVKQIKIKEMQKLCTE